jgi:C-terminal processing protease CtpA/Prc
LHRGAFPQAEVRSGPKYQVLPGNVGYVDLDRIDVSEVDAMMQALAKTNAIVFDNRGYPRGTALAIASRMTDRTRIPFAMFTTPVVRNPIDADADEGTFLPAYQQFVQVLHASDGAKYRKPTVMLIDARAISQSEHSALIFRAVAQTRFVGTPTAGADGDVTSMVVPGGLSLYFSGQGVSFPDGTRLQRTGIRPDRWVEPSAADVAASNDIVLQAGLDEALRLAGARWQERQTAVRRESARERDAARSSVISAVSVHVAGTDDRAIELTLKPRTKGYVAETNERCGRSGGVCYVLQSLSGADAPTDTFGTYNALLDVGP